MTSPDTPLLTSPDVSVYGPARLNDQHGQDDVIPLHDPRALIPQHLASLTALNIRPGTILQRRRALGRLCQALNGTVDCATPEEIAAHLDRGLGPQGRADEITHLRGFYRWALLEGHLDTDPTVRLKRPRLPRRLPRPMPDADVELAFRHAPLPRVRPALYLAAYAGLRAHEIAQLRAEDLHWLERFIFIADEKGGGQGSVPLCEILEAGLRSCALPTSGWLFPYLDGRGDDDHIPGRAISKAVNAYLHDLGIKHTLHTLRHWYGTKIYQASGRDLRQTQELLRHSNANWTALYTFVDPGEAGAIADRLPRVDGQGRSA